MNKYSPETIRTLIDGYEKNENFGWLCRTLKIPQSSAKYHLMRAGIWRFPHSDIPPRAVASNTRCKAWTVAEDQRLLELRTRGRSVSDCARMLGRSYGSARTRLLTLAAHESYREDQL